MGRLVKLWRLPGAERRLLVEAWWRLLAVALVVRLAPFPKVQGWASRGPAGARPERLRPAVSQERAAHLVAVAGRHHLLPIRCLERALALKWLLARRGLVADLRIGVRREGGPLEAHAWLEIDDRTLFAGRGGTAYLPLGTTGGRLAP